MDERPHITLRTFEFLILFPLSIVLLLASVSFFFVKSWGMGCICLFVSVGVGVIGQGLPHRKQQTGKELARGNDVGHRYGDITREESTALAKSLMGVTFLVAVVAGAGAVHQGLSALLVIVHFMGALVLFPVGVLAFVFLWSFLMERVFRRPTPASQTTSPTSPSHPE